MNLKLASLGIVAAVSFAACTTTDNTNVNRLTNGNSNTAVVVNSNQAPITNTNTGTMTNSNSRSSVNYNGAPDVAQRTSIESDAKSAGRTIGTGANDWWLWGKTRAALAAENDLRDSTVNVDVSNAVVTLTGSVKTQAQVTKANTVAKVDGVTRVDNRLKVDPNATMVGGSNSNMTNTNKRP